MRRMACVCALVLVACGGSGETDRTDLIPGEVAIDLVSPDTPRDVLPETPDDRPLPDTDVPDHGHTDQGNGGVDLTDSSDPESGPTDLVANDPGSFDHGPMDTGVVDVAQLDVPALGTKTAGELCKDAAECSMSMSCIRGQFTPAHCNILCTLTTECQAISPGTNVECQNLGGNGVCMWTCQGGVKCPGGLTCDGYFCG